ncbi:hypothetical protein SAMN05216582_1297 [Selenomonas ruminantium]|uniref:Flagellar operon protein TIGR03826 n=1 Tax=Selenomonas ruminantium TaxID=971 RepID=A0A1M6WXV3_SELRU|nr:hypothetical protein SAMN05216582_1297 [Selenomonas ruminantium]
MLKNCPLCGKLFADTGAGCCQKCYDAYRNYEVEVKKYVEANPNCSAGDIVKHTGAPLVVASQMIQDGQFAMKGRVSYPCSRCGKLILTGVYCTSCQQKVQEATSNAHRVARENERKYLKKDKQKQKESGLNILKILRGK